MSCQIIRNSKDLITNVLTPEGLESQLFNSIAQSPIIKSNEDAYEIYKNAYSGKFDSETAVSFVYKIGDNFTNSYKEALNFVQEGQQIKAGFLSHENKFTQLVSTVKQTDKSTEQGYINKSIQDGLLEENKVKTPNGFMFQATGESMFDKHIVSEIIVDDARAYMGSTGVNKDGILLSFDKKLDKVKVKNKNAKTEFIDKNEIDSLSVEELESRYDFSEDIILRKEYSKSKLVQRANKITVEDNVIKTSEDELQMKLLNFLNKLGVKIVSLSDYVSKYNIKNGVNPSAKALADIANKVIAVQNGEISLNDLTEETIHFIVASLPKSEKENVLRNIEKSDEWSQYSQAYLEIYGQEYSEQDALEATKEEVLGKIALNAVLSNFSTENKTEIQSNFINKVLDFFDVFVRNIQKFFQPQFKNELDSYVESVEYLLNTQDIIDTSSIENNRFRLYSVSNSGSVESKIRMKTKKLLLDLTQVSKTLRKSGSASNVTAMQLKSAQNKLEGVENQIEEGSEILAVSTLVDVAQNSVKHIEASIKDSENNNKNYFLSDEEHIIYVNLTKNLAPSLTELGELLKQSDKKGSDWETLIKRIDEVSSNINTLSAKANILNNQVIDKWVDKIINKYGYPESYREYIYKWTEQAQKDTVLLHAWYGQLGHASDAMLNLMGYVTDSMLNEAHIDSMEEYDKLFSVMRKYNFQAKDLDKFVKNGYWIDEINHADYEKAKEENYAKAYQEVMKSNDSIEDIIEKQRNRTLVEPDAIQQAEIYQKTKEENYKISERRMNDSYYTAYEEKLSTLNDVTKNYLSSYYADLARFKEKAVNEKGQLDFSMMSEQDKSTLNTLNKNRAYKKSYTDENGNLKKGLKYSTDGQSIEIDENFTLSEEAQLALDLNKLDSINKEQARDKKGLSKEFLDELNRIDKQYGRKQALDFLRANAYIGFNSEFWEGIKSGTSIVEKLTEAQKTASDEDNQKIEDIKQQIISKNKGLRSILKMYSNKNMPSEIDVDDMSESAKDSVLQLQQDLTSLFERARAYTRNITSEEIEQEIATESTTNKAYNSKLKEEGIFIEDTDDSQTVIAKNKKQFDFAQNHMTETNKKNVLKAKFAIEDYLRGATPTLPFSLQKQIEDKYGNVDLIIEDEYLRAEFLKRYAQDRVLPYYKRFAPRGYSLFELGLEESGNLVEFLTSEPIENVDIIPNYSFYDETENKELNPNFRKNYKGGYSQPKVGMFENKEFKDLFGEVTKDELGNLISSSKNKELFELYKVALEANFTRLRNSNVSNGYNMYTATQIRAKNLERTKKTLTGISLESMRNSFQDFFNFTEDDQATGDTRFGEDVKVIPQEFVQKVPENELSTDVFFALAAGIKAGTTRKARVKYFGDLTSIADKIATRDYNGKSPDTTNTVKMMKSALDYSLYGIKEELTYKVNTPFGQVDMAKLAKQVLSYIKFRNLGLNWIIPMTSAITGKVNSVIESYIGDVINRRSYKLGVAEYRRLMTDAMTEAGEINAKSKLVVLGRYFQAFDIEESFKNSNYGKAFRLLSRTGHILHSAANFPIYGQNLLATLHDFRVVDGKVINFTTFKNQLVNKQKSPQEVKLDWNKYEENNLYKFLDVEAGKVSINEKALQDLGVEDIQDAINRTTIYAKQVNEYMDGQLSHGDRLMAQRNFLLNFTTTHRGWLSIATQRRFKSNHLNLKTGQFEEGSYSTLWSFLNKYFKEYKTKNFLSFYNNFKELYKNGTDEERMNLRRVGIEMASLNTLILLGILIRGYADDDDNKDEMFLQATAYLYGRTINELSSSQLAIASNYDEVLKTPILGWDTAKTAIKVSEAFDQDVVKGGTYGGLTKQERYFIKVIPGLKSFYDANDYYRTRKTFEHFNDSNVEDYTGLGILYGNSEK